MDLPIDKQEFDRFSKYITTIDLEDVKEIEDNTDLHGELACSGGSCEIY